MSTKIIQLKNISKSFGPKKVLENLSLEVDSGEMVAILGRSGSGKTTLINILALFDSRYTGDYFLFDQKINRKKDYSDLRNKRIGFVFQSYYLINSLNVRENILLPYQYESSKDEVDLKYLNYLTQKLNITDLLNGPVNCLSGGEKQRVAIARALIHKPDLLICDEPTGNLDEETAKEVMNILISFKDEKHSILIVTHDRRVAAFCNRCLFLKDRKLNTYEQNK
jgi:ABC-type lipoprotein export system ATPase subunit